MSYSQSPDQPGQYPGGQYSGGEYPGGYGERPAPSRPGTLLAGCILTWIGSALGLLFGLLFLGLSSNNEFGNVFDSAGVEDAANLLKIIGGVLVVWCGLAAVLAVFTVTGKRWAAIALAVLGGLYAVIVVIGIVNSGDLSGVVGIAWVALSLVLIFNGSREWFDYKAGQRVTS